MKLKVIVIATPLLAPLGVWAQVAASSPTEPVVQLEVFKVEDTRSYLPLSAGTATKSDSPLRDVPFAISTITRAVIDDQRPLVFGDALRNVAGYQPQPSFGGLTSRPRIRGFTAQSMLKNGFRQSVFVPDTDMAGIAQVEVLKGPASALYGRFEPGGVVNVITKKPLDAAHAAVEFTAGSDAYYRATFDVGGPLTDDRRGRYRVNAAFEDSESYRDFCGQKQIFFAPVVEWRVSEQTKVTLQLEGTYRDAGFDRGYVVPATAALGQLLLTLPVSRNLGEPTDSTLYRGYMGMVTLEHSLNQEWTLRAAAMGSSADLEDNFFTSGSPLMPNATTYNRRMLYARDKQDDYTLNVEISGKVTVGSQIHRILAGADFNDEFYDYDAQRVPTNSPINPFAPVYGAGFYGPPTLRAFGGSNHYQAASLFLQDEVGFCEHWRLLLGGRHDSTDANVISLGPPDDKKERSVNEFSPRVGLTFAPTRQISIYGSYARSFVPEIGGTLVGGELTDATVGTQYEAGIKSEALSGKLFLTLSRYDISKTNVIVGDPANPGFSIQVGEQRIKGTELEIAAQPLPGWNLLASYAHAEGSISKDTNTAIVGKRIVNVPKNTASFWSTYEFARGDFAGLKFGGGFFYVGDRAVNNANLFFLPSYTRFDALISYQRGDWRASLNVQNVTDKKYFDSAGGVFHPMAPRQFFVSVRRRF